MADVQPDPSEINHNVRVIHVQTGEHVICNFTQIREDVEGESRFVAYQCLYPLVLSLNSGPADENGLETFQVGYRRWNPYTPLKIIELILVRLSLHYHQHKISLRTILRS